MNFDADAPASSVFRVYTVRVPKLKNAFRVVGSLIVGLVTWGFGPAPSSQRFVVRSIESGAALREFKWSEGEAVRQDLGSLSAGEFADLWLQESGLPWQEG